MPSGMPPLNAHVTYTQQYRRCGKPTCVQCATGATGGAGHGPYWFAYWREGGRAHSLIAYGGLQLHEPLVLRGRSIRSLWQPRSAFSFGLRGFGLATLLGAERVGFTS